MKTILRTLLSGLFLMGVTIGHAQTSPTPHNLATQGNYSFTNWPAASPAGTYPASMAFHHWSANDAPLSTATVAVGGDVTGVYNSTSTTQTRMNGLDASGFSFKNNSGNPSITGYVTRRLGQALLAISTTNRTNVQVSWKAGKVGSNTPVYALTCQYRIGTSGSFTTIGQYLSSNPSSSVSFGPVTLPSSCDNKAVVQIRWAYTYVSGTTTIACPQLFVDDISVTSIPLVSITPLPNTCSAAPAFALTDGTPVGGVYSGPGVSGGNFDPSLAGTGTHTITYTYTDGNGISNFTTTTIDVNPSYCIVTSTLKASSCGATGLTPSSWIYCEPVYGATSYQFTLTNTSLGYSSSWTINAPYLGVSLLKFPGLQFGATYDVTVKVMYLGTLSGAGAVCQITLGSLPTTSLTNASCGATNLTKNSYIYCNTVSGATQYQWTFSNTALNFSYVWSPAGPYKSLQMNRIQGLVAGETYDVSVKAIVGGITTPTGPICSISLSSSYMNTYEGDGSKQFDEIENLVSVYPNPVSLSSELNIQLKEIQNSTIIITDIMGRLVFEKQYSDSNLIKLDLEELAITPGIYTVSISNGITIENNKIVVTK